MAENDLLKGGANTKSLRTAGSIYQPQKSQDMEDIMYSELRSQISVKHISDLIYIFTNGSPLNKCHKGKLDKNRI